MNCFLFTEDKEMSEWAEALHKMLSLSVEIICSLKLFPHRLYGACKSKEFKEKCEIKVMVSGRVQN